MAHETIRLTLPAVAAYSRIALLTAAGLATRAGFTYDEVDALRTAIDRQCAPLYTGAGGAAVEYVFSLEPGQLDVSATPSDGSPAVRLVHRHRDRPAGQRPV